MGETRSGDGAAPEGVGQRVGRRVAAAAQRAAHAGDAVEAIVADLRADPEWRDSLVHWHAVPARPGRTRPYPEGLDPRLVALFRGRGIDELWEHQARAVEAALAGRDVLVATPTASGKTLGYLLPVLQALCASNGAARSLFLFPTKALAQDQSAGLNALVAELGEPWHAATYDGDTPPAIRRTLRDRGHLILTNPWMLHSGLLPNHAKWSELFRDLAYVVVDEVHTLSGVFGSSVANVLRRLVRIARHYGSRPRFLASSATLREPAEHARMLFGREVEVVSEDASPAGRRVFGVLNPPLLDPVAGLRANALEEARRLARAVCGPDWQAIFFCQRRTAVEVLTRYLKEAAPELGLDPDEVRGYRGGYLPLLRREIETGLRSGAVKVVVTTNALELGIDVGALDVAVLVGYPGSQASFWQRVGRVGRRGRASLAILVARSEPVDQYLAHRPESLFGPARERTSLDPDNLVILSEQLKCAAFELPFRRAELAEPPPAGWTTDGYRGVAHVPDVLDVLAEDSGLLLARNGSWYWTADAYPAQDVPLETDDIDNVVVLDAETGKAVGEIDRAGSITTVHEGAIYQVEGETWKVERFDWANRRAYVKRVDSDYFTEAQTDTEVRVLRLEERRARGRAEAPVAEPFRPTASGPEAAALADLPPLAPTGEDCAVLRGEVHVTTLATQFKKIRFYTRENVGADDIRLPAEELDTEAFVLTLSQATASELALAGGDRGAAWRGVGSLLRRVAPLFVRCRPSDLGLATQVRSPHFRRPAIFLYDRVRGGVGLATQLFCGHAELLAAALRVVRDCACERGCPACVGPTAEVGPLGKETATRILRHLAGGPPLAPSPLETEAQGLADAPEAAG